MASKREKEWEALARQVSEDLERERQSRVQDDDDEDDQDDDTEYYVEVPLEDSEAVLDVAEPVGFQQALLPEYEEELELDPPGSAQGLESIELDEPEEVPWLRDRNIVQPVKEMLQLRKTSGIFDREFFDG